MFVLNAEYTGFPVPTFFSIFGFNQLMQYPTGLGYKQSIENAEYQNMRLTFQHTFIYTPENIDKWAPYFIEIYSREEWLFGLFKRYEYMGFISLGSRSVTLWPRPADFSKVLQLWLDNFYPAIPVSDYLAGMGNDSDA